MKTFGKILLWGCGIIAALAVLGKIEEIIEENDLYYKEGLGGNKSE